MNVYSIGDLRNKLLLLGLDLGTVKILIEDVEYLEGCAYLEGIESKDAKKYRSECDYEE